MRSATSFFNLTLFRKNWKRFWPLWVLYFAILLFTMPVALLLNCSDAARWSGGVGLQQSIAGNVCDMLATGDRLALGLSVVFGLLFAMAVFSYLFSARSAGGIHSLPIRREGLFLTNFLSGLTFLVVPNVVVWVLVLISTAAVGCFWPGAATVWLLRACAYGLIFFSGAVFCALCTGHILALPVFYAVGNILVMGIIRILEEVLSAFVFGYTSVAALEVVARWCTPVFNLISCGSAERAYTQEGDLRIASGVIWNGNGRIAVYAVLAVVVTLLALALYRPRQLERAGDVVAVGWMRPVFRYGVAVCCALTLGVLFYAMFGNVVPQGAWSLLVFLLVCGAVGYFAASMLLAKSFRVLRHWKGCVGLMAALVVLVCVMELDLTGFERRVPEPDQVAEAAVWGMDSYPYDSAGWTSQDVTDPETIALLLQAHRDIVDRKDELEERYERGDFEQATSWKITYYLKNGGSMTRYYRTLPLTEEEMDREGSFAACLERFISRPEFLYDAYSLAWATADRAVHLELETYDTEHEACDTVEVAEIAQAQRVWAAVRKDLMEGDLGAHTLLQGRGDDEIITGALWAEFRVPEEDTADESSADDRVVSVVPADESKTAYRSVSIALRTTADDTLQALRDIGVITETRCLLTMDGEEVF